MSRQVWLVVVVSALVVVSAVTLVAGSSAGRAGTPFYLIPSPTTECRNVSNCVAVAGPWVVVPAHAEATFLFGCPMRRGFVVGGTDARASSTNVRVWFDGELGAPIGLPPSAITEGAVLLFHAVANNQKPGWFQPIVGCVSLVPASKVATVSFERAAALPGASPGAPLDLRAKEVVLSRLATRTTTESCPQKQTLVGSWDALAFDTSAPPDASYASAATINRRVAGREVHAVFRVTNILLAPLSPLAWAQIGAMCES